MSKLWAGVEGIRFVDAQGRQLILRGVNLGGDSKLPYPDGGTDRPTDFSDHATVSFVGRPFPLDEMDEHLARLRDWGFNTLRLLVTWEAVEHAGPGQYDGEFIEYIGRICERAADYGFFVFLDFHQDAWSRMSGGSGAPCWLFDKLGLDYRCFHAADAVHVMQYLYDYADPRRRQEERYPSMSWTQNYRMPVNGIMWTAFFAGRSYTPDWRIDGRNVQDYLQDHFFGAVRALAARVRELPNVLGFDSLNEPGLGWIGQRMSAVRTGPTPDERLPAMPGPAWTPLAALQVARGLSVNMPVMKATAQMGIVEPSHTRLMNPHKVSIWKDGIEDPFERAGAWRRDGEHGVAVDEDFFFMRDGRRVDAERDFMQPFFARMAATIREQREDWLLFAEINPYVIIGGRTFPAEMPDRCVNACHWYDAQLLWTKHWPQPLDAAAVAQLQKRYGLELAYMKSLGDRKRMPTLIGEFGIPYDLNEGLAYSRWADGERGTDLWHAHTQALQLMYEMMDLLQLSSTQWNYTASNRNDLRIGDGWNQEDLSIFSRDQQSAGDADHDGGRAVAGFCRPYVRRSQGALKSFRYEPERRRFSASVEASIDIGAPTEIFVPRQLSTAPLVTPSDPDARIEFIATEQLLRIHAARSGTLQIDVAAS